MKDEQNVYIICFIDILFINLLVIKFQTFPIETLMKKSVCNL